MSEFLPPRHQNATPPNLGGDSIRRLSDGGISSLVKEVSLGWDPSARPLIVLLSVITKRKRKRCIASVRGGESANRGGVFGVI